MANAAKLLGELLDSWAGPESSTPEQNRGMGNPNEIAFWREHARAVQYLVEIEEEIDELASVDPDAEADAFYEVLPALYKAVCGMEPRWGMASGAARQRPAVSPAARLDLRQLSGLLATAKHLKDLTEDSMGAVMGALIAALKEVEDAEDVEPRLRAELVHLLSEAIERLADSTVSTRQKHRTLRDASSALVVASRAQGLGKAASSKLVKCAVVLATGAATMLGNAVVDNIVDAAFEPFAPAITSSVERVLDAADLASDDGEDVGVGDESSDNP